MEEPEYGNSQRKISLKKNCGGKVQYCEKEEPSVVRRQVETQRGSFLRYERALEQAEKELEAL